MRRPPGPALLFAPFFARPLDMARGMQMRRRMTDATRPLRASVTPRTYESILTAKEKSALSGHVFRASRFDGIDFSGADLSFARFEDASLVGCNFSSANLKGATFIRCDL